MDLHVSGTIFPNNWVEIQVVPLNSSYICPVARNISVAFGLSWAEIDFLMSVFMLMILGHTIDSNWRRASWSILKLSNQSFSSFSSALMSRCDIFSSQSSIHFFHFLLPFNFFLLLHKHLLWLCIKFYVLTGERHNLYIKSTW